MTDARAAAAAPELAVLSALAHADEPDGERVAITAIRAAARLDAERGALYHDLVLAGLSAALRDRLEALMAQSGYHYPQSDFARKHFARGEARGRRQGQAEGRLEGRCEALLAIFAARRLRLTAGQRARVLACDDLERLERWIAKAITAPTVTAALR